jgi:DNA-binding protein HU-beta
MNKAQLVANIAQQSLLSKADAERALDATLHAFTKTLRSGEAVTLVGFGTFSVTHRKARTATNPRTGDPVLVPAKKVAKFKPSKVLNETL